MERVSSGAILLAFVAVLCGLLGVYAIRRAIRPRVNDRNAPRVTVVPMASRDIKADQTIALGDVALVRLTRSQMKDKGIKGMFMSDPDQIIGRTTRVPMTRGETFDTQGFYADGMGPGIAERLKPGQRAVTIEIVGSNAVVGFAGAGQMVDVLFRSGPNADNGQDNTWHPDYGYNSFYANNGYHDDRRRQGRASPRAVTLMQGVEILALENNTVATGTHEPLEKETPVAVTLAVAPDQAEVLRVVEGHGEVSLALRNPGDETTFETIDSRSLEDILGYDSGPRVMEIYRGKQVQRMMFDGSGQRSTSYDSSKAKDVEVIGNANRKALSGASRNRVPATNR